MLHAFPHYIIRKNITKHQKGQNIVKEYGIDAVEYNEIIGQDNKLLFRVNPFFLAIFFSSSLKLSFPLIIIKKYFIIIMIYIY